VHNIDEIFNDRTCYKFLDKSIETSLLEKIYDTAKLGATSANSCPLRIIFVASKQEREKLYKCLAAGNVEKTKTAPVTAIFAYDSKFYELMPKLFPHHPEMESYFASEPITQHAALQNSTLQAAYFMIVARAHGLACGPMGGFDDKALNDSFFPDGRYKVNFLCNLGYADGDTPYPKLPRLIFAECCKFV